LAALTYGGGNNIKAESFYRKILIKDTTNFVVYKQLATISNEKSDMASLICYLQKANFINPAEPDVASDLTDLYVNIKLIAKAKKVLSIAIAADTDNIVLLNSMMKLQYAEKNWTSVIQTCLRLVSAGDASPKVFTKLGIAYYNIKSFECCISAFMNIDEIARDETSYYYTALSYKELKDHARAKYNLRKAIEVGISPNISSYYGEIADSDVKLEKYREAALAYQKSLQFDVIPMVYYSLGILYDASLKDKKSAVKYFKKYLASKPPANKQRSFINYSISRLEILSR
jgi:tetratricopeptide (TPR) repeat protein